MPNQNPSKIEVLYSEPFESVVLQALLFCLLLAIVLTLNPLIAERSLPVIIDAEYLNTLHREHILWLGILIVWILYSLETHALLVDHIHKEVVVLLRRLLRSDSSTLP